MRDFSFWKQLLDSDESFICLDVGVRIDVQITLFQELEIVSRASGRTNGENETRQKADNQQGFDGVSLFFPE